MKIRWHHWLGMVLFALLIAAGTLVFLWDTGLANLWMRHHLAEQIEKATGARVEMGRLRVQPWKLSAEIDNLTLHGLEDRGMPPLFHADKIHVAVRVVSFFGRKIALQELILDHPEAGVRFGTGGQSNIPVPKTAGSVRQYRERLFDLEIGKLQINDGSVFYNDATIPLAVEGGNFEFVLNYDAPAHGPALYAGKLDWQDINLAALRYIPFHSGLSAKFTITSGGFELDELKWKLPHSELDARAELPSFAAANDWNFRYHGRLALEDVRNILREPTTPDSNIEFAGTASVKGGAWTGKGHFDGRDVDLPYDWFHAKGLEGWGDFEIAHHRLLVPQFSARALGGTLQGPLTVDLNSGAFRIESRLRGMSLPAIFAALDNPDFPVHALHWDAVVDVDAVNTWTGAFEHFQTRGEMRWSAPANLIPGKMPAEARVDYDYNNDRLELLLNKSEISTPTTWMLMDGPLGGHDSAVELALHTDDLTTWDDFINTVRGADAEPEREIGSVDWRGRILGPIVGPTFVGHFTATDVSYGKLYWDKLDGVLSYSPDDLQLTNLEARRGKSSALLDLRLQLDGDWSFRPIDPWSFSARLTRDPTDDLQAMFDTHYPVTGVLSGEVLGSGTRGEPEFDGNLTLEQIEARGMHFDRLTAQLHIRDNQVHFDNADLRMDGGRANGYFSYGLSDGRIKFALDGTAIELNHIPQIQTGSFPISGTMGFALHGEGQLRAPQGDGTLQFRNLKLGTEVEGDFDARVASNGKDLHLELSSTLSKGVLQAALQLGLSGDYPVSAQITAKQFDLDPFIVAGLHLKGLTGHSSVDGQFTIAGGLRDLNSLTVDVDLTSVSFDYDVVKLQNEGDIKLVYRKNEVRVAQAYLRGTDTDFHFSGFARFDGDRPLNLAMSGKVNMRFATGLLPMLNARGAADVRVSVGGTMSSPSIIGRVALQDVSAAYDDFPTGLNHVTGEVVFDRSRALFENVSAESGGGHLTLRGSMSYGDGPIRYDLDAVGPQVRIRYPVGMSWLLGGTLHLEGSTDSAVLSGNVQIQRLLLAEGVDMATLMTASSGSVQGPATSSSFLRNLQFDIGATTAPNAHMEWTGAHVEMEGSMRLRGNWDRPILLGSIHLLNGDMTFRDNKYTLSRGDIDFSNPFRLDPILNIEATTTIDQYEVTLDFSGPASNLSLSYRSDPPLPDSDIIALLALGSTGTESALRSSSAQTTQGYGATALLSEAISSQLGGRIEKLFGISKFRVDPFLAGTASEQNAAARVTIEEQLGRAVTVTYSTNAASDQEQVIQVEYALRRDITIIGLRDINGTFSLSVEFTKHFK
ncbi:MAG: translocation/assembly module TamB domain-containing protein [Candidatus Acidiferrales bacterium]